MRAMAIIPRTSVQLESRKLVYVAAVAKNRQVSYQLPEDEKPRKRSLAEIAKSVECRSLHSRLAPPGQTPHCLGCRDASAGSQT